MSFGKMITLIDIIETTTSQDEEGFVKKEDNIIASTRHTGKNAVLPGNGLT